MTARARARSAGALLASLAACGPRHEPIASCASPLDGEWHAPTGTWVMLDNRGTLEAYPIFPDTPDAGSGIVVAPRVIDLVRDASANIAGTVMRRYMRGATECISRANARITACKADSLELVLADPGTPIFDGESCAKAPAASSRKEIWTR